MIPAAVLAWTLETSTGQSTQLTTLAACIGAGIVAWLLGTKRFNISTIELTGPLSALRHVTAWAVLAALGLAFAGLGISLLLHRHIPGFGATPDLDLRGWPGILAAVLAAPLAEEILYRGVILRHLLQHHTPRTAIVISAALFAAMHGYPVKLVNIFLGAVLLGWLYTQTKSIWPGVVCHMAVNTTVLLLPEANDAMIQQMSVVPLLVLGGAAAFLGIRGLRNAMPDTPTHPALPLEPAPAAEYRFAA